MKRDKLRIRPQGEVADLTLDFGWSCGKANPGIYMELEKYESFNNRGGVLTKLQVKKIIKYLEKYLSKCKDRRC